MVLDDNVSGDVLETLKQLLWLRDFVSSLKEISITNLDMAPYECIRHISMHSLSRLNLEEGGSWTIRPRDETNGWICALVRYVVIYQKIGEEKILYEEGVTEMTGFEHFASPQVIIDNLRKAEVLEQRPIKIFGIVKFESIFKVSESRFPFTLTVYSLPES